MIMAGLGADGVPVSYTHLLGNSCGSFLAQMLAPVVGIPALLGNPYFMMTEFQMCIRDRKRERAKSA